MSLVKRATRGMLWAQVGKGVEAILAFFLSIVVVRRLGPEDYGEYGLVLGIIGLGMLLSSLGFPEILAKHVPRLAVESNPSGATFLLRWALGWRLGLTLVVVALFWILPGILASSFHLDNLRTYRWAIVLLFLSQNLQTLLLAFFSATLRMKEALIVNLLLWSSSLALTLVLFHVCGVSVTAVLYASAAATTLSFAVGLFLVRDTLRRGDSSALSTRPLWRFGATIWLTNLASFGLDTQTDILFMGYLLADKAQIGFYRAAVMPWQRLKGFLFGAWAGLILPVLSESYATQGASGIRRAWTSYMKFMNILTAPLLVFFCSFLSRSSRCCTQISMRPVLGCSNYMSFSMCSCLRWDTASVQRCFRRSAENRWLCAFVCWLAV